MKQPKFHIELLSHQLLPEVPSASGIIKFKEDFYAIGDDSPYMFQLDSDFNLLSKTLIHSSEKLDGETIPKFNKPDFEAMEMINEREILIFGSGSKSPERDVCVWVEVGEEIQYKAYDISLFYENVRNMEIMKGHELDIEGLAYRDGLLYLFNRGRNVIFSFSYIDFITYCKTGIDFPIPKTNLFTLPKINGLEAGFSGATTLSDKPYLLFTAAVEDTPNSYEDGEILGSFIGLIELKNEEISDDFLIQPIPNPGLPLKVESVIVDKIISENKVELVLVTDNDGKPSEVLRVILEIGD